MTLLTIFYNTNKYVKCQYVDIINNNVAYSDIFHHLFVKTIHNVSKYGEICRHI